MTKINKTGKIKQNMREICCFSMFFIEIFISVEKYVKKIHKTLRA